MHQVLATLGYGDAIGHEVLGIQRVLRAAGYSSEIFVETADPRLEHLTRDYRDLPEASAPDNLLIHHFSIGSRASRIAYALPDRMVLVYHNITPPEYFVDVHPLLVQLCFRGRRELGAYVRRCDLALGDSEFNRQELEALGFPDTGVLPVVPDFSHLDGPPNRFVAGQFDDEWTNVLFVGRVIPNKRIDDVIRFFDAYQHALQPAVAAAARRVATAASTGTSAMLQELLARLRRRRRALPRPRVERGADGVLRRRRRVPVRARARGVLRAAGRGVLQGGAGPRVRGDGRAGDDGRRRRAVRSPRTRGESRRCSTRSCRTGRCATPCSSAQDAALARLRGRDFAGTLLGFVDRVFRSPRRPAHRVAFDFWEQVRAAERLEELRDRPARATGRGAPAGSAGRP